MGQLKNLKEDVGHPRSLVIRLQIMDGPDEKDTVLVTYCTMSKSIAFLTCSSLSVGPVGTPVPAP